MAGAMIYIAIAVVVLVFAHWWLARPDRGPQIVKFRHGNFYAIRDHSILAGYVYLTKTTMRNYWVTRDQSYRYEFIFYSVEEAQKRLDAFLSGESEIDYGSPVADHKPIEAEV
jgi:Ni,Fe-hydrogenase I cytochrome b subunit